MKGHILDALNRRQFDGEIIVENGRITDVIECVVPSDAPYILPGLVDSHIHIESSMVLPENFGAVALRHGTVAVVTDPHEIANVLGVQGVKMMIESSRKTPLNVCFCVPSCVPATNLETSGATLGAKEVEELMALPEVYGLAEMMFCGGVTGEIPEVMAKLDAAKKYGKVIDGHAPGLTGDDLKKYAAAGVSTDHECVSLAEGRERIDVGMMVQIREGSAAKDFEALSPLLTDDGDNVMFCSDDKHPDDLLKGHINLLVKRALQKGYPLWNVLRAASVNAVRHYKLPVGLLQKGDSADFIVVDNLRDFNVLATYIKGDKQENLTSHVVTGEHPNNFHAMPLTLDDLKVKKQGEAIRVIVAKEGSLVTGDEKKVLKNPDETVDSDVEDDVLKLVVYNRYQPTKPAMAFIKGIGLKSGAIGSTVAHDSHNIIAVGTNDEALLAVINDLIAMRGGLAACTNDGKISHLNLPIGGLMSGETVETVAEGLAHLRHKAHELGTPLAAPFMTLSFMALPVIPALKITDKGLFDVTKFAFTDLFI